jgi:hypothetical protein
MLEELALDVSEILAGERLTYGKELSSSRPLFWIHRQTSGEILLDDG